jgi:hypothetical protein
MNLRIRQHTTSRPVDANKAEHGWHVREQVVAGHRQVTARNWETMSSQTPSW